MGFVQDLRFEKLCQMTLFPTTNTNYFFTLGNFTIYMNIEIQFRF